jgi:hypothetical protein
MINLAAHCLPQPCSNQINYRTTTKKKRAFSVNAIGGRSCRLDRDEIALAYYQAVPENEKRTAPVNFWPTSTFAGCICLYNGSVGRLIGNRHPNMRKTG